MEIKKNVNADGKAICPICEDEIETLQYTHAKYEKGDYKNGEYESFDLEDADILYFCPSCGKLLLENDSPDDILSGDIDMNDYEDERKKYKIEIQQTKNKHSSSEILPLDQTDIDLITITDMQREIKADNVDKISEQIFKILDEEGLCDIYSQVDMNTGERGYKKGYIHNAISYAIAKKI